MLAATLPALTAAANNMGAGSQQRGSSAGAEAAVAAAPVLDTEQLARQLRAAVGDDIEAALLRILESQVHAVNMISADTKRKQAEGETRWRVYLGDCLRLRCKKKNVNALLLLIPGWF